MKKLGILLLILIIMPIYPLISNSWTQVFSFKDSNSSKSSIHFTRIQCADSSNCFAIGQRASLYPYVVKSQNGGKSWSIVLQDTVVDYNHPILYPMLIAMSTKTKNQCIIACDSGTVMTTSDGGDTWSRKKIGTKLPLISIDMLDSLNGLITSPKELFKTTDGGQSWTEIKDIPLPDEELIGVFGLKNVAMLSNNSFVIKSVKSFKPIKCELLKTDDGGVTWKHFDFPINDGFYSYWADDPHWFFIDSLNGWAVGGGETGLGDTQFLQILHTSDGGQSWEVQFNDTLSQGNLHFNSHLQDIAFKNRNEGIAVGQFGSIMKTTNGGNLWSPEFVEDILSWDPPTMRVCYAGDNILIADYVGRIFRYDNTSGIEERDESKVPNINNIYPNPARDYIQIAYDKYYGSEYIITDMLGSIVGSGILTHNKISISTLPNGMYIFILKDGINRIVNKFAKE